MGKDKKVKFKNSDGYLKLKEQQEKDELIKQELLTTTDYMDWLYRFTRVYPRFLDDTWLYQPSKISNNDRANVDKLHILFKIIEDYANEHEILSKGGEHDKYYSIMYNGYGYDIGMIDRIASAVYVCQRSVVEKDYINFNDIMNDKKDSEYEKELIKKSLEMLKQDIINLYNMGVSRKTIYHTLDDIEYEETMEKPKTKKKIKK